MSPLVRFATAAIIVSFAGCQPQDSGSGAPHAPIAVHSAGTFTEATTADSTITLHEDGSTVLGALGATLFTTDSLIVLPDMSEGNVKVYALDGSLVRRFGRKGDGPGEFRFPAQVAQDEEGYFHVVDILKRRVSVVDPQGGSVRQVNLASVEDLSAVYPIGEGKYLAVGTESKSKNVLFFVSREGKVESAHLPIGSVRPRTSKGSAAGESVWRSLRSPNSAMVADTLFVMLSYSDSLWRFHPATRTYSVAQLQVPGYRIPEPAPDDWSNNRQSFDRWVASHHGFRRIQGLNGKALINMTRGQGAESERTAITNFPDGVWRSYTEAPSITFGLPPYLFSLATDSTTTLQRFKIR